MKVRVDASQRYEFLTTLPLFFCSFFGLDGEEGHPIDAQEMRDECTRQKDALSRTCPSGRVFLLPWRKRVVGQL